MSLVMFALLAIALIGFGVFTTIMMVRVVPQEVFQRNASHGRFGHLGAASATQRPVSTHPAAPANAGHGLRHA